ncbi:MAG: hypothetical protein ACXWP5_04980 [Bdellovibrionota bacterium]
MRLVFKIPPIFAAICLLALEGRCETRVILFGGVENPNLPRNSFIQRFAQDAASYEARGWEVAPLFGNSVDRCTISSQDRERCYLHYTTGCCPTWSDPDPTRLLPLAASLGIRPQDIPSATHDAFISTLEHQLDQKAGLKAGDQLLIHINDHGASSGGFAEAAGGLIRPDDPQVQSVLERLKKRGIRIGFVVDTCYSGVALSTWGRHGCVITSQTEDQPTTVSVVTGSSDGESLNIPDMSLTRDLSYFLDENAGSKGGNLADFYKYALLRSAGNCYSGLSPNAVQISGFAIEQGNDPLLKAFLANRAQSSASSCPVRPQTLSERDQRLFHDFLLLDYLEGTRKSPSQSNELEPHHGFSIPWENLPALVDATLSELHDQENEIKLRRDQNTIDFKQSKARYDRALSWDFRLGDYSPNILSSLERSLTRRYPGLSFQTNSAITQVRVNPWQLIMYVSSAASEHPESWNSDVAGDLGENLTSEIVKDLSPDALGTTQKRRLQSLLTAAIKKGIDDPQLIPAFADIIRISKSEREFQNKLQPIRQRSECQGQLLRIKAFLSYEGSQTDPQLQACREFSL